MVACQAEEAQAWHEGHLIGQGACEAVPWGRQRLQRRQADQVVDRACMHVESNVRFGLCLTKLLHGPRTLFIVLCPCTRAHEHATPRPCDRAVTCEVVAVQQQLLQVLELGPSEGQGALQAAALQVPAGMMRCSMAQMISLCGFLRSKHLVGPCT